MPTTDQRSAESNGSTRHELQQSLDRIAAALEQQTSQEAKKADSAEDRDGFGPETAMRQALESVKMVVRREAFIMAFNDAFLIVAIGLLIGAALVWFCKKPESGSAKMAA